MHYLQILPEKKLQFAKFITMDPEQQLTKFAKDDPVG